MCIRDRYVTIAIPLSVIMAILVWVVLEKTRFGYELKATGFNKHAAKYCGMAERRNTVLTLAIAGGVAANSRIRGEFTRETQRLGVRLCMPPLSLCGDNGAMIGAQGYYEYLAGRRGGLDLNAYATMDLDEKE